MMHDLLDKTLWIIVAGILSFSVAGISIYLSVVLVNQPMPIENRDVVLQLVGGYIALFGVIVKAVLDMAIKTFASVATTVVSQQSGTQEIKT